TTDRQTDRRCPALVLSPVTVSISVLVVVVVLLLCVRACRPVFVIPGSMSSIKIYLSDFS
ncbi:hypothetical protein KR059_001746, partial [Drosophila kikkawai]